MSADRHKWRRFSLRSLLVLVTVAAILLGLVAYRVQCFREQQQVLADLVRRGFEVRTRPAGQLWRALAGDAAVNVTKLDLMRNPHGLIPTREDIARLSEFATLESLLLAGPNVTDDTMKHVARMEHLTSLSIAHTCVTDEGIALLADHPTLGSLGINCNITQQDRKQCECPVPGITDAAFEPISQISQLTRIFITSHQVTGRGLHHLASLSSLYDLELTSDGLLDAHVGDLRNIAGLKEVFLRGRQIADESLAPLTEMPQLKNLQLIGTSISESGLRKFVTARPDVRCSPKPSDVAGPAANPKHISDSIAAWRTRRIASTTGVPKSAPAVEIYWSEKTLTLRIDGSENDDEVYVASALFGGVDYIAVWADAEGRGFPVWHGKNFGARCARVRCISIFCGDGHDIVNLNGLMAGRDAPWNGLENVDMPIIVQGGRGRDLIIASGFLDVIAGGEDNDEIHADDKDLLLGNEDD